MAKAKGPKTRIDPRARRIAYVALLAVIVAVGVVPASVSGMTFLSGNASHLVLTNQSAVDFAYGQGNGSYHPLVLASVNGTTTVTPSYTVTVAGVNNTTTSKTVYPTTIVLETNLTVGNLNSYSVSQFVENITGAANLSSATLEYGSASGDNVNLTAMVQGNITGNSTAGFTATMDVQAMMLTGNQSSNIFVVLNFSQAPATAFTVHNYVYGASSSSDLYQIGEDVGYVGGGIGLLALTVMILPFFRLTVSKVKQEAFPESRKKRSSK